MNQSTPWVWNRPLRPDSDRQILVPRGKDVERLLDCFKSTVRHVFVWTPPKCGYTTFLNELCAHLDAESGNRYLRLSALKFSRLETVAERESVEVDDTRTFIILDDFEKAFSDSDGTQEVELRIKQLLQIPTQSGNTLTQFIWGGNAAVRARLQEILEEAPSEFELTPMTDYATMETLILKPFANKNYEVRTEDAQRICEAAGGNPYLIQRLASSLAENLSRRQSGHVVHASDITGFLSDADSTLSDYFDYLANLIIRDDSAPFAINECLDNTARRPSQFLQGIGVLRAGTPSIVSELFSHALEVRCSPLRLAKRYSSEGKWLRAVQFYEVSARKATTKPKRIRALKEALNAAEAAGHLEKFTEFGVELSQLLDREDRLQWLSGSFMPLVSKLLGSQDEPQYKEVFDGLLKAVDAAISTGRHRLYLTDSTETRLQCRHALGLNAIHLQSDSIPLSADAPPWKIKDVYFNGELADIPDTLRDEGCNQAAARRYQVYSTWVFPIVFALGDRPPRNIGILCVDNPYHSTRSLGNALEEKEIVEELLRSTSAVLHQAKKEADKSDLKVQLEVLTGLQEHLLTDRESEEILNALFTTSKQVVKCLSLITVRLKQGFEVPRMRLAGFWPGDLAPVFEQDELQSISLEESVADPGNTELVRQIPNVRETPNATPALKLLLDTLEERGLHLELGTLLSYRLEIGSRADGAMPSDGPGDPFANYFGMVNFYASSERPFQPDEVQMLVFIAKQVGTALLNAQSIRAMHRQGQGMALLDRHIGLMDKGEEGVSMIKEITEGLCKTYGANSATYLTVNLARGVMKVRYTFPEERAVDPTRELPLHAGVSGQSVLRRAPYVISVRDLEWASKYVEQVPGIRTSAAIPMLDSEREPRGVFVLESTDLDAFSRDDIGLIQAVVNSMLTAINLHRAREQLEQRSALEALGLCAGLIGHQVSNTVANIPNHIGQIRERLGEAQLPVGSMERIDFLLNLMHEEVREARAVSRQLWKSSYKVEERDIRRVCLKEEVDKAIDVKKGSEIPIECAGDNDLSISTDPERLHLILGVVLDNAVQACELAKRSRPSEPMAVFVSWSINMDERTVSIRVRDTGKGARGAIVSRLCKAPVQSNWVNGKESHGIGLFLSGSAARMLGGDLELSDNTESGAEFTLILPLKAIVDRPSRG